MNAASIKAALRASYCQPEWAIFFEVSDGVGSASRRTADAVAMNMWPSRGLEIRGMEIKVSRSDLLSELKDPSKAEAVGQYCNSFYLVTPSALKVDEAELPLSWGWITVSEKGGLRTRKQAELNKTPADLTQVFVASLLRSSVKVTEGEIQSRVNSAVNKSFLEDQKRIKQRVEEELEFRAKRLNEYSNLVEKIKDITGDTEYLDSKRILAAVKAVYMLDIESTWTGMGGVMFGLSKLNRQSAEILEALTPLVDAMKPQDINHRVRE